MKNGINSKKNKSEKEDDTFIYAIALLGLIMLFAILVILKLFGLF